MKTNLPSQCQMPPRHAWRTLNLFAGTLLAALFLAPAAFAATTVLLDANGTDPGFWDGVSAVNCDVTSTTTWTTNITGVAAPTAGAVGNNFQIGYQASDFNGAVITFSTLAATLTGTNYSIIATNAAVTWASSGNAHFNTSPVTVSVATNSTLLWTSTANNNGFNFNNKATTFAGGGTMNFQDAFCANAQGAAMVMNMPGGTNQLNQTKTSNWGATVGANFTLTNGTLQFGSASALADVFHGFLAGDTFKINGGTIDNISGAPGTIALGAGGYSIGGNFNFTGSSSLDFGTGAVTNTANHTVTISANTLAIGGVISGNGNGLTLAGTGTLLLYGADTYSGNTVVNAGITLALTNGGSIASSPLIVSNSTFDISGLSAGTTLPSFGISNSTLVVQALASTTTNIMATTLSAGGSANIVNITTMPLITGYPAVFHIIKATTVNGTLNFGLGTLPSSSPPFNAYLTNVTASGSVDLVVTGGPPPVRILTWTGLNGGQPNGTWDAYNTATWLDTSSSTATVFQQLDLVTFNDSATGLTAVNLSGNLLPGGLTVSNNVLPYTFTGGSISDGEGSLTLNKQGAGTLLLQESGDSFSGGINAGGGTVIIDNDNSGVNGGGTIAAGATIQVGTNDTAGVLPNGTITDNGKLIFNRSDNITVASGIAGNGAVNSFNTNIVILADSGTSSGNWTLAVQNGTLQAVDNSSLGALPGGAVTITNGGTLDVGGNTTANNANFGTKQFNIAGAGVGGNGALINSGPVTQEDAFENITLTADSTFGGPNRWDMRNGTPLLNLAGHTLTKTNANQISLVSVHVTSGNIVIQQGTLSFEATPNFDTNAPAGTITVNSGGFLGEYRDTAGSFRRGIVLNGGGTMNLSGGGQIAYLDAPILLAADSTLDNPAGTQIFNGVISDGGLGFGLTIAGNGTNLLSATNTYSGSTILTAGTLGLTGKGSISGSPLIVVTNSATLDLSGSPIPLTGAGTLWLGDDVNGSGTLILGNTLVTNFNYISISNAVLQMAVADANVPVITVTNLNLGDNAATCFVNITALPPVVPAQFPLIKYASAAGTYNFSIGTLPPGYSGLLVNNAANKSVDLAITGLPSGIWNGGSATGNNWSDAANWNGSGLQGNDLLSFAGTTRLNNTNNIDPTTQFVETASGITFVAGAGAFTLNGNPVTLAGNIVNSSTNPQTIDLGLDFSANVRIDGGSGGLFIGNGITNTATGMTTLTLAGNGTLTNLLTSTTSSGGTNSLTMNSATANWTLVDNSSSAPMTNQWPFEILAGTFNFGNAGSAPVFSSISAQGQPQDNQVGDIASATGTLNMVNGTLTTLARLNTGILAGSIGVINQVGGTLNIGGQFQGANGNGGSSFVTNSGGTLNIGGGTGQFYVASRGPGVLTLNGSGAVNCGTLDVSRSINSSIPGTVNLNGGILTVSRVGSATANQTTTSTGSTAAFNFNGGTLEANASSTNNPTTFFQGNLASPAIPITTTVKSGGAIIDDGGFAITVLEPLQHDATLGATPDGGLIKNGSGTLTLTAASTYTGSTVVSNGTLAVNGSLGVTAVTVANNATLVGTGSLGSNVTVNAGGALSPGAAGTLGTLTVASNVTLNGTAAMDINATTLTNDVLKAGGITYGGTLLVTNIAGTPAVGNSFKLFSAASYTGAFTGIVPATPGAGLAWDTSTLNTNGILHVIVGANTSPINIIASVSGGTLTLTWPADHIGWTLQAQTNSLGAGLNPGAGAWFDVPGSTSVNSVNLTVDPAQGTVFYRLKQ